MRQHLRFATWLGAALALAPALAGALGADQIFRDGFEPARWVAGYHVGYERGLYPVEQIDFRAITHLMVGRIQPLASGAVTTHFDIDDVSGPIWAHSAVDAAHATGRKAVLMVGGAGEIDGWRGAANAAHRATFVTNLLAVVDAYGFDGLDLDWEPLEDFDRPDFVALAGALRSARPGLLLTVPVGWINANFADPPDPFWGETAALFDRIHIMSYGMAGPWGWETWHGAALFGETGLTPSSVSSSVAYYLASGVPRNRLGIGLGFYGNCWQGVTGPHQDGGDLTASDGAMSYRNIVEDYYQPGLRQWDASAQVPWLGSATPLGPQGCTFISYDDAEAIAAKGQYVRDQGLGGTIIWTIGQAHFPQRPVGQRDPLLDAVRAAFLD